jgi:hypothetical protein
MCCQCIGYVGQKGQLIRYQRAPAPEGSLSVGALNCQHATHLEVGIRAANFDRGVETA